MYDAVEIRGNPQKYEEKIVGRPHYGKLSQGVEDVVWQGSFGLPVLIVDEGNRLPYDSQDVVLQGIDTGRWNYQNRSLFEGKKPTFMTMNERTGNHQNGLLPALRDRFDIVTENGYWTSMIIFDLADAKRAVQTDLCRPDFVTTALANLAADYSNYQQALASKPIGGHLTREEKAKVQEQIRALEFDNEGLLFIQAMMAEMNYSAQYGSKRAGDPPSQHTHDKMYAGVAVRHSFSPRSVMAIEDYAKAMAWLLGDSPGIDHVRYIMPHIIAHKAEFTDDYRNAHGNDERETNEILHLATTLVKEVYERYTKSIQPMLNFIAQLQDQDLALTPEQIESKEVVTTEGQKVSLKEDDHDHPLMKDLVRQAKAPEGAFYEE
jgi:hypothetical protein